MNKEQYIEDILAMLKQSDDKVMLEFIYTLLKETSLEETD